MVTSSASTYELGQGSDPLHGLFGLIVIELLLQILKHLRLRRTRDCWTQARVEEKTQKQREGSILYSTRSSLPWYCTYLFTVLPFRGDTITVAFTGPSNKVQKKRYEQTIIFEIRRSLEFLTPTFSSPNVYIRM